MYTFHNTEITISKNMDKIFLDTILSYSYLHALHWRSLLNQVLKYMNDFLVCIIMWNN